MGQQWECCVGYKTVNTRLWGVWTLVQVYKLGYKGSSGARL